MNDDISRQSTSPDEMEPLQLARPRETLDRIKQAPFFAERFAGCTLDSLAGDRPASENPPETQEGDHRHCPPSVVPDDGNSQERATVLPRIE